MLCMMRSRRGISVIKLPDRFPFSKTTATETFFNALEILYVHM